MGIDLGTATTQTVFSKLHMQNTASYFSVPRVSIVDKELFYEGDIHTTPLLSRTLIDAQAVRKLILSDYESAGITPDMLSTGAVIITGESARKENAKVVLEALSDLAGEFVVSTAGPDLEGVIAGKGSGAFQYSVDNECATLNIDIGGGTSNYALFKDGRTLAKGCLDIGGRLVRFDEQLTLQYVSDSATVIAKSCGLMLKEGERTTLTTLKKLCDKMEELLFRYILSGQDELISSIETPGSTRFFWQGDAPTVFFSGGVAAAVYGQEVPWQSYGDIGVLLGRAIATGRISQSFPIRQGVQTIRATVVGAGSHTTNLSGSTIFYSDEGIFPLKNIPVLKLSPEEESALYQSGGQTLLAQRIRWMCEQTDSGLILIALQGLQNPSYEMLKRLAAVLAGGANEALPTSAPLLVCVQSDIAKALGQTLHRMLEPKRVVVCIDAVDPEEGDYIDIGRPLMEGLVVPVVTKTLIFG